MEFSFFLVLIDPENHAIYVASGNVSVECEIMKWQLQ
jgi:hypothetical protein